MLIVEGTKGSAICQLADFPATHEEKLLLMFRTGFAVGVKRELGALAQASFVSEAWMSVGNRDEPPHMPPSEDPNRTEVLVIHGHDLRTRRKHLTLFAMIRDGQGRLTDLKRLRSDETGEGGPPGEARTESPLLDAFVAGFHLGRLGTRGAGN